MNFYGMRDDYNSSDSVQSHQRYQGICQQKNVIRVPVYSRYQRMSKEQDAIKFKMVLQILHLKRIVQEAKSVWKVEDWKNRPLGTWKNSKVTCLNRYSSPLD